VDQYACHAGCFFKNQAGRWELEELENRSDSLTIRSLGVQMPLDDIYYRVKL
jgi:hypothetical protein